MNHITILKNVLVDESKAAVVRMGLSSRANGLTPDDDVTLYIPFGVTAVDPLSGAGKAFIPAVDFWRAGDKSALWTLSAGKQKNGSVSGSCFFVRGEVVHPELAVGELENLCGGNVFTVSAVDTRDFGGLMHWEVGAH